AAKWSRTDGSRVVGGTAGTIEVELARATQAWYPVERTLVAAWVVEAYTSRAGSTNGEAHRTVLAADGGRVLEHRSLVADAAYNYRVFAESTGDLRPLDGPIANSSPHPTGTPNGSYPAYIAPVLVSVDGLNHPASGGTDPWLANGRTETQGNNVEAYADFNAPSGLSFGDFRATTTAAGSFDRVYDTGAGPLVSQGQQMAAVTSLFYSINWLHDFWYDAGFTETANNAQENNYGRGGQDRDAILAEAQDNALGGSRNNANMSTPADGLPPRMQVFVWSGKEDLGLTLQPAGRTPAVGSASFAPASFNVTAGLALADDGAGPSSSDACTALTTNVAGKIVLVDRGSCTFKTKALQVQNAGAIAMVLANNAAGTTPPGMGEDATITTAITIGALSVTMDEGTAIKADLAAGAVTATARRQRDPDVDGGNDATLVAHEYGHYLHHRLSDCGTTWCRAISEGWADFLALMLIAREGDDLTGAFPFSVYTTRTFSADPAYFGIRRAPYSTNPAINSLSFRHMADGEALPTTHPFQPFGNNAEVHNAGEVWAAAMWEGYVALQQAGSSFDDVRAKMAKYVVSGLLMMPADVTPTEARDSILAAVFAASPADHDILAAAFARRGFGSCAVSPGRDSSDFVGIVESTVVAGRVFTGTETVASTTSCDEDGVLDVGETMRVTFPVTNQGHLALTNVTATLASTTPGVTVTSAPTVIASIPPYGSAMVEADVELTGDAEAPLAGEFTLSIAATGGCTDVTAVPLALRLNVDDVAEAAATDTFDTGTSVWTTEAAETTAWRHLRESALDGMWHGADLASRSDSSLISPVVTVGTEPLSLQLTHRYEFEVDGADVFDGAVIEYSTDLGATWTDIATIAPPGYTGMLPAGNALGARMAFTGKNAAHPLTDTLTLDLGTQLAGAQLQLRFRVGTDDAVGAPGWEIDDVVMTGIVGTPFPSQVADATSCDGEPPTPDDEDGGGCCDAGPVGTSNAFVSLLVLGLVLRRRSRQRR
ncbi:MAG: M36 family metallopeptidase, partial [Deltaproteobacteria bacterium]|nr:M36 family metallopeptidase [Deltaproteobacteria bacterium]